MKEVYYSCPMIDALFVFWFVTGMLIILAVMLGAMMEHQLDPDPKLAPPKKLSPALRRVLLSQIINALNTPGRLKADHTN
jgi:hypothetical protein